MRPARRPAVVVDGLGPPRVLAHAGGRLYADSVKLRGTSFDTTNLSETCTGWQ
jgi:hypothetical protein